MKEILLSKLNAIKEQFDLSHAYSEKQAKDNYKRPPSISEKLPWMEYDTQHQCFYLDDGKSVGALFELIDVPSEARPQKYLEQLRIGLQGIFQDVFPQYFDDESPWIVQFYLQDELSFASYFNQFKNYIPSSSQTTYYTKNYLDLFQQHCHLMTTSQGLFVDHKVSGNIFRGKTRKIRAVVYRKLKKGSKLRKGRNAVQDLSVVTKAFMIKLRGAGVKVKQCAGEDFYDWMVRWFNPFPKQTDGNIDQLLVQSPYPGDEEIPFGYDFSEKLFFSIPRSDAKHGVWYFDDQPHKYITISGLNSLPKTGHLSVERHFGNHYYSLFDKFPEGSVFVLTVVIQNQEQVKNHIFHIEHSTLKSSSTESEMAREDCALAKRAIESNNYFFPSCMGVYIRGKSLDDLYNKETEVESLLSSNSLMCISGDYDLMPIDSYLRYLPMCYDYDFDRKWMIKSRYRSGKQLSQLLPVYGREKGTNHPGVPLFNRCGEPLVFDPFNPEDKDFNSHLLLLGSTGSGKSAMCIYLMMHLMAVYRPRLVVVDAGNSFGLLSEYFKSQDLQVNRVEISFNNSVSLNPFAESEKLLIQVESLKDQRKKSAIEETEKELEAEFEGVTKDASETEKQCLEENRDYMGEMCLACELMITGGEKKEAQKISRQDRMMIMDALVLAAQDAKNQDFDQMIADDVVAAFCKIANQLEKENRISESGKIQRLREMADGLKIFCKDPLSAQYFNRRGKPWPDADVTMLEMGLFKDEGYEAQRALAFMGAMNKTASLAEQHQHEQRFTVFFADECHIVTNNPLTAVSITKCSKMSRKIGLWLWLATQNVQDFPDEARKMLSMIEFWICLGMSESELKEVERFKPITEEERSLFHSVRKSARKYVEGVILCNRFKGLFRNIPPRLSLALAMTEKSEKAQRQKLMQEHNCTEIEAAKLIAGKMVQEILDRKLRGDS